MDFDENQRKQIGKYIGTVRDALFAYTQYQLTGTTTGLREAINSYFQIPEEIRREIPDFSDKKWKKILEDLEKTSTILPCSCGR